MFFNSGPKAKENHESWESLFRRTLSKERLFTFTRPTENPIHWIQFLDPFDQQDTRKVCKSTVTAGNEQFPRRSRHVSGDKSSQLKVPEAVAALAQAAVKVSGESRAGGSMDVPGWPLIPFSKVQMFKCEKCCLEFCSPMNHRRHLRMIHRRPLHSEKEDLKSLRQQFSTFWDNLSPEEAYEIAAVKNLHLEDLTGEKVARALTHLLQQPSLFALPHSYVKSGAMLLELVQSRSPRLHLTSSELFKILDGSSEKTFPSFGLNAMQRYIFEGGAGKVGLETKNLVASLGFLVEHNLVKAFIKDKDEEAWRCQTALVEEEEASQRKQAQIQARKRMKKSRQKDKEQKALDSAMRPVSDSDTSDDEISSIGQPAGLESRPSSNTFENLNHKLAGEGSDFDHRLEVLSTAVSSPSDKSLVLGDPGELVSISIEVGRAHKAPEVEAKDASNLPATKAGNPPDASGVQKPYNYQKRKYPTERSLSPREASPFPYQQRSPKERRSFSARNIYKKISANEDEEGVGLGSSCFPRAVVRDPSENQAAGSRPMQYTVNPVRMRAQIGAAVWTKKMPKCGDSASAKITHHAVLAKDKSPDVSDSVLQADGLSYSSVGVSSTAAPHDRKAGSVIISSTATSNEEVSVSSCKAGICNHESSSSTLCVVDSGQYDEPYQGGHNSTSMAPVVIGSVVIGSVSVSLDSVVSQKEPALTVSSCKDLTESSKVVDATQRELSELVDPAERPKETNGALHENGAINHVLHKEPKGDGKSLKIPYAEWKENKQHSTSHAGMGNFIKPSVVQGGSFAGAKMKVWRPVVSNSSQDCCIGKLSALGISSPDSINKVSSNQSPVIGGDINNLGLKELELGQLIQDNSSLIFSVTSADAKSVVEARESDCTSTLKAVACFLSQRWSEALNTPDSLILSVGDEEGCSKQDRDNTVDVQSSDTNVYSKDSRNPSPRSIKEVPGKGKQIHGLWKQGCSGSAMAVNRRLTGKDNLHFTSRFTGYRYVPK